MLAVVEYEQSLPVTEVIDEHAHGIAGWGLLEAHRRRHDLRHEIGAQGWSEINKPDAVLERPARMGGDIHGKAALPCARDAADRHQTRFVEQLQDRRAFALSTDEIGSEHREVGWAAFQ